MAGLIVKKKKKGSQDKKLVVIVSKKVSKKATERNLMKRRVKSIFKELTKDSNKEYTVIVKPEALKLNYQELKNQIKNQIN